MAPGINRALLKNLPTIAFGSASILAAIYLGLSPRLMPALYNRRLFRPFPYPEGDWDVDEVEGIKKIDAYFRATDGSRAHGWLFLQPTADQIILFSHGNTGNITSRIRSLELLLRAGASVFLYDYRGYGRSEGRPTVRAICEDGVAAFDFLVAEHGFKPSQIVVYGESLGCAVASEIAAERPVAGIILQSGFTSLRRIGTEAIPLTKIYPPFLFPQPQLDNVRRMAVKQRKPLLIIHGCKDQTVPFSHGEELFLHATEPKQFVKLPDAAHSDIWAVAPDAFVDAVRTFLQSVKATE